jgi:hypothetical protein
VSEREDPLQERARGRAEQVVGPVRQHEIRGAHTERRFQLRQRQGLLQREVDVVPQDQEARGGLCRDRFRESQEGVAAGGLLKRLSIVRVREAAARHGATPRSTPRTTLRVMNRPSRAK